MILKIKTATLDIVTIQLDEFTGIPCDALLLVNAIYVKDSDFKEQFLFCQPLWGTTKDDMYEVVSCFFVKEAL